MPTILTRSSPAARRIPRAGAAVLMLALLAGCRGDETRPAAALPARPSILLVTLDTTRADAMGPEASKVRTPSFNGLAARGRRYLQAYATVPETLPSHASIMTGLYPAGHAVHENARFLAETTPVLAERLRASGYRTAAVVASFVLARRFGLARGFDAYDDAMPPGRDERSAREVTEAALGELARTDDRPLFLWVHYWDPHAPYTPPEPYRSAHAAAPYYGEIASMDEQLGRLLQAFEQRARTPVAVVVVGDHGEGLGDHGEALHGNLLYQSTVRVPLVLAGPGVTPGVAETPVSIRRVYHTVLDWAGVDAEGSLRAGAADVVLGEAMKPFLEYGWQPQIMAVSGRQKAIFSGVTEVFDVVADPGETRDLGRDGGVPAALRAALDDYPVPSPEAARAPANLSAEDRKKLASLGYVSAAAAPVVRKNAPRPADMARIFGLLEEASTLFVQERYREVIPLLERILAEDRSNLDAMLRLATAHSMLGHDAKAVEAFRQAAALAPGSDDVRTYLALHYARSKEWERAGPMLEQIVADAPERLPAVEALAAVRLRQHRLAEAVSLLQRAYALRTPSGAELARLGEMAMEAEQTGTAIAAFEGARAQQGRAFSRDLELGVLYLAARRFADARDALDRVPASHPRYPMALFKRAQLSVLLNEPDRAVRIDAARRGADATTRALIARERLFQGGGMGK